MRGMGPGGEGRLQDAVTVPRVGTNIRLQAVALAPRHRIVI